MNERKREWFNLKEIEVEDDHGTAFVAILSSDGRHYSVKIGRKGKDGQFVPAIPLWIDWSEDRPPVITNPWEKVKDALERAVAEAEATAVQRWEDRRQFKEDKERAEASKGSQQRRVTKRDIDEAKKKANPRYEPQE